MQGSLRARGRAEDWQWASRSGTVCRAFAGAACLGLNRRRWRLDADMSLVGVAASIAARLDLVRRRAAVAGLWLQATGDTLAWALVWRSVNRSYMHCKRGTVTQHTTVQHMLSCCSVTNAPHPSPQVQRFSTLTTWLLHGFSM